MITIIHILLSIVLLTIINFLGKVSTKGFGYANMADIQNESNLGYNLLIRVLSPTVFISFLTLILYQFNLTNVVENIWYVALYFWIINIIILISLNRFVLVNKSLYLLIIFISTFVAYATYELALKRGIEYILPEAADFRTELWFIIFAYFYALLNNYQPDLSIEEERKRKYIINKYIELKQKYSKYLKKEFKDNKILHASFFSIMIVEEMNRPALIRFIERVLFRFKIIKSTGIMQVRSKRSLSDPESIQFAQEKILETYKKLSKQNAEDYYMFVPNIAQEYNGGGYDSNVYQVSNVLKDMI